MKNSLWFSNYKYVNNNYWSHSTPHYELTFMSKPQQKRYCNATMYGHFFSKVKKYFQVHSRHPISGREPIYLCSRKNNFNSKRDDLWVYHCTCFMIILFSFVVCQVKPTKSSYIKRLRGANSYLLHSTSMIISFSNTIKGLEKFATI